MTYIAPYKLKHINNPASDERFYRATFDYKGPLDDDSSKIRSRGVWRSGGKWPVQVLL